MPKHRHELHLRDPDPEISDVRAPYWRRAHRDWRFITVVVLMLAAISTYVMTLDLSWHTRNPIASLWVTGSK
jgi:hypothetical protein